jgi:predicted nuclease with TOPRIM domain
MSENPTEKFPSGDFEQRVMAEFAWVRDALLETRKDIAGLNTRLSALEVRFSALEDRLSALEDKVDARLMETRPIWEAVQSDIKRFDTKLDNIIRDLYDVRTDIGLHDKRLYHLETKPTH